MAGAKAFKIVLVGPKMVGKTALCNYLAEYSSHPSQEYTPTAAARILECDRVLSGNQRVSLELWDCSGDTQYKDCWPAMLDSSSAAVFVYDPSQSDYAAQLDAWRRQLGKLKPSQVLVLAHSIGSSSGAQIGRLPGCLDGAAHVASTLDDEAVRAGVAKAFDELVARSVAASSA